MSLEDFLFKKFYKFYTKEFHYEKLLYKTLSLPAVFYLYMNILMYFFIINI